MCRPGRQRSRPRSLRMERRVHHHAPQRWQQRHLHRPRGAEAPRIEALRRPRAGARHPHAADPRQHRSPTDQPPDEHCAARRSDHPGGRPGSAHPTPAAALPHRGTRDHDSRLRGESQRVPGGSRIYARRERRRDAVPADVLGMRERRRAAHRQRRLRYPQRHPGLPGPGERVPGQSHQPAHPCFDHLLAHHLHDRLLRHELPVVGQLR